MWLGGQVVTAGHIKVLGGVTQDYIGERAAYLIQHSDGVINGWCAENDGSYDHESAWDGYNRRIGMGYTPVVFKRKVVGGI